MLICDKGDDDAERRLALSRRLAGAGSASRAVPRWGAEKDELARGSAKESVAARKSGSVTFSAELAEKSGAALSGSESGFVGLTCACDAQAAPSRNADTNKLFIMCLSEGCSHIRPQGYGKQHQDICLRSFASGTPKEKARAKDRLN